VTYEGAGGGGDGMGGNIIRGVLLEREGGSFIMREADDPGIKNSFVMRGRGTDTVRSKGILGGVIFACITEERNKGGLR